MTAAITRPALRYYGGKWRLAPWIISHFPAHETYVEPFAGAGSVLLQKPPSILEVYNDLDGAVVNFFRVLREDTDRLYTAVRLTPYARAELDASQQPTDDPFEAARRTFVGSWLGRGGTERTKKGWRYETRPHHRVGPSIMLGGVVDEMHAVADRLRDVMIECSPALEVIQRFDHPGALFYCDPPYVRSARTRTSPTDGYKHEMSDEDHRELARVLHAIEGKALISGYPSALYDELYADWPHVDRQAAVDQRTDKRTRTERLWISPRAAHGQQRLV